MTSSTPLATPPSKPPAADFNLVFVLFDNVTQLDFAGPVQFLSRMPGANVCVVSHDGGAVTTDCGFSIVPRYSFADCPQASLLCVPGGHGVQQAIANPAIVDFVRAQSLAAQWITSVCTGAFILGAAGLLCGKRAATHWGYTHLLSEYGATYEAARVVHDGNIITAGGVTSGIDFGLEVIAAIAGNDTAQSIQLGLEYNPAPPFTGGHPDLSPNHIVQKLREQVYDAAASRMAQAIADTRR
jgi:cyclohexyl-isocyanide hydratase